MSTVFLYSLQLRTNHRPTSIYVRSHSNRDNDALRMKCVEHKKSLHTDQRAGLSTIINRIEHTKLCVST